MASGRLLRNATKCVPLTLRGQMYTRDSLQPFYGDKEHAFSKSLTTVYNVFHLVAAEIIFNSAPHGGSRLLVALISVALKSAPRCTSSCGARVVDVFCKNGSCESMANHQSFT